MPGMNELYQITVVGLAAVFFIVVFKLVMLRIPIPGLADIAAFV